MSDEFDNDDTMDAVDIDAAIDHAEESGSDIPEQMETLVTWLIEHLVDDATDVSVEADQRGNMVLVRVRLPEEMLGKVIGRGGRIAKSLRGALGVAGARHHVRVSLDIEGQEAA